MKCNVDSNKTTTTKIRGCASWLLQEKGRIEDSGDHEISEDNEEQEQTRGHTENISGGQNDI